jgi:hypothetical protein
MEVHFGEGPTFSSASVIFLLALQVRARKYVSAPKMARPTDALETPMSIVAPLLRPAEARAT